MGGSVVHHTKRGKVFSVGSLFTARGKNSDGLKVARRASDGVGEGLGGKRNIPLRTKGELSGQGSRVVSEEGGVTLWRVNVWGGRVQRLSGKTICRYRSINNNKRVAKTRKRARNKRKTNHAQKGSTTGAPKKKERGVFHLERCKSRRVARGKKKSKENLVRGQETATNGKGDRGRGKKNVLFQPYPGRDRSASSKKGLQHHVPATSKGGGGTLLPQKLLRAKRLGAPKKSPPLGRRTPRQGESTTRRRDLSEDVPHERGSQISREGGALIIVKIPDQDVLKPKKHRAGAKRNRDGFPGRSRGSLPHIRGQVDPPA